MLNRVLGRISAIYVDANQSTGLGLSLIVSVGAGGSLAMAQGAYYDPQQGSGDGRYQVPHTGFWHGKFWTDTRYR